jgi:two-component sensor histidine kinase
MPQTQKIAPSEEGKTHRVKNALLTIDVLLEEMTEGYRFDDNEGPELFESFKTAILLLKESYNEMLGLDNLSNSNQHNTLVSIKVMNLSKTLGLSESLYDFK